MGDLIQFRPRARPADRLLAAAREAVLFSQGYDTGARIRNCAGSPELIHDDLTMGRADPEMEYEAPSGDCA